MKKIIAILLALCALAALTVTASASASAEPAAAAAGEETVIAAKLTEADALAAALKDAGEKEANVEVTKNKLSERTTEDGETIPVYTVKFSTDTTEYKYYIEGNTGAVIYKSVEFQNPDIVLKSRGGADSGTASAEPEERSGRASGEMSGDEETVTDSARTGRHKGLDDVSGTSGDLTEETGV